VASAAQPAQHTYTFRITLLGVAPAVWRLVACPGSLTLSTLHTVIQAAMGWKRLHPFGFEVAGRTYRDPADQDQGTDAGDPGSVTLEELGIEQRATLTYLYDRGDDWVHQIIVEGVAPVSTAAGLPLLLGGDGACPPESSGGPGGYAELLDALRQPDSDAGRAAAVKLGSSIDPAAWDSTSAVQQLAELMPPVIPPVVAAPVVPPVAAATPAPQPGSPKRGKRRGR
jgi:hypothetical protein